MSIFKPTKWVITVDAAVENLQTAIDELQKVKEAHKQASLEKFDKASEILDEARTEDDKAPRAERILNKLTELIA